MLKSKLLPVLASALVIVSQACAPAVSPPDANSINTAIAQTIVAGLTQTATSGIVTAAPESPTAAPTLTPELPALPPTETLTPIPVFTSTPAAPQISVSVPTNCRVGPGTAFERVGALLVGQVAEVVGRNAAGDYWIIRNPNRPNTFCWLWGGYATLTGNTGDLPVQTPPPTPTPAASFDTSFVGKETCTGTWWVDLDLENTGGVIFRSISLTVRDLETDTVVSAIADGFTDNSGCLASVRFDELPVGGARVVSSSPFTYDITGHRLRATITLCSNRGQSGTCVTQVVNFTP